MHKVRLKTLSTADVADLVRNVTEQPVALTTKDDVEFDEPIQVLHEEYIATEGQNTFTLRDICLSGDDFLMVFVNGLLNQPGHDYSKIDESTVRFSYPLGAGARVTFCIWR